MFVFAYAFEHALYSGTLVQYSNPVVQYIDTNVQESGTTHRDTDTVKRYTCTDRCYNSPIHLIQYNNTLVVVYCMCLVHHSFASESIVKKNKLEHN